jgi:RNA polymerase sigma factor (sigma-70 family)
MSKRGQSDDGQTDLAQLVVAAMGDGGAMSRLLQRCRPAVYALILDRVHRPEVAEDLAQEALSDVARGLSALREPAAFAGWLRELALNRCRRWWRRPVVETTVEEAAWRRLVTHDAFTEAARRDEWRRLRRALENLPEKSRVALLMHVFAGASQAEIAQFLDLTPSAVGVRIHRARAQLRLALRQEETAQRGGA